MVRRYACGCAASCPVGPVATTASSSCAGSSRGTWATRVRSPAWSRRAGNGGGKMAVSDPLGDMLTRIRNAQRARHSTCMAPASKLRANVLDVLRREGFIRGFTAHELRPGGGQLRIQLKGNEG